MVCEGGRPISDARHNVNDYKPLLSSAPAHSILNAQAFHYTNSAATDIRKTFARVQAAARRQMSAPPTTLATLGRCIGAMAFDPIEEK